MLQLSAPGTATPRYASEIQEEWSTKFRHPIEKSTPINEPGIAEIKPHKDAAIRKGLYQLRRYLRSSKPQRTGRPLAADAGQAQGRSVWLITYLPWPENTLKPAQVRVFAHKLDEARLTGGGKGDIPPFDSLVRSRRELSPIQLPPTILFPTLDKPDMFGMAVEDFVRKQFATAYVRPRTYHVRHGRRGADVLWNELSGLFRELAAETGDTYWRELSDELLAGP